MMNKHKHPFACSQMQVNLTLLQEKVNTQYVQSTLCDRLSENLGNSECATYCVFYIPRQNSVCYETHIIVTKTSLV